MLAWDCRAQDDPAQPEMFEREMAIEQHLAAASHAEREGRIDQPSDDCAWRHYRSALDLDPDNAAAQLGLLRVQEELVSRAEDFARDMDFEAAERTLEDALLVRGDQAGSAAFVSTTPPTSKALPCRP
jgi:hypothetical protein